MLKNTVLSGGMLHPHTYYDTPAAVDALHKAAADAGVTANELIREAVRELLLRRYQLRFATMEDEADWGRTAPVGEQPLLQTLRDREAQSFFCDEAELATEVEEVVNLIQRSIGKRRGGRLHK